MRVRRIEVAFAVLGVLFIVLAWRRWDSALAGASPSGAYAVTPLRRPATTFAAAVLDSAVDATVGNDPFRLANAPSKVAYDPAMDLPGGGIAPVVPVQVARPSLVLRGIIGGPPWQAVLDGIPGQGSGTIVRGGMTFDKLAVRSVSRDTVTIQGADTTWKLTLAGRSQ